MNYINLKIKDCLISMTSNKLSRNIFIDLNEKSTSKFNAIEKAMNKSNILDDESIKDLQIKKILIW